MLTALACLKGAVFDHVRGVGSRPEGRDNAKNGALALDEAPSLG